MSDGGKGSAPRPFSIAHDEWSKRWDAIFGRDNPEKPEEIQFRCTCGKPLEPGVVHRADAPCYVLGGRA